MVAVSLLVLVVVDTAISGYMIARVRHLHAEVKAQARVISDLSDSLVGLDEEVKEDAE